MVERRINRVIPVHYGQVLSKLPVVPRSPILQEISGEYEYFVPARVNYYSEVREYLRRYFEAYYCDAMEEVQRVADTGLFGRTKWGKVLRRIGFTDAQLAQFLDRGPCKGKFYISVRYNDILRCSVTPHFSSCFRPEGCNRHRPIEKLGNPNTAICFVRDKAGHFLARVFISITSENYVYLHGAYGELAMPEWGRMLQAVLPWDKFNTKKKAYRSYGTGSTEFDESTKIYMALFPTGEYND